MSRRELLTKEEREQLFGVPIDEASLVKHYTLSPDDLERLLTKRGAHNILGAAVQLVLLRHPGFGLRGDETVADALLRYLAGQLNVPVNAFRRYARRVRKGASATPSEPFKSQPSEVSSAFRLGRHNGSWRSACCQRRSRHSLSVSIPRCMQDDEPGERGNH
jgi:Domain of unknown function (DUF4158)